MIVRWMSLAASLAACGTTPSHLALPSTESSTTRVDGSPLARAVGVDPLLRLPRLPATAYDGPSAVLLDFARAADDAERAAGNATPDAPAPEILVLRRFEAEHPGTVATALVRGYALRLLDNRLASTSIDDEAAQADIAAWITPLSPGNPAISLSRLGLSWVASPAPTGASLSLEVRTIAEHRVLAGWLAGPDVPLGEVRSALEATQYDALRGSPIGRILVARAENRTADASNGLAALQQATRLALLEAAADRDKEQAAWADLRASLEPELGKDPVGALLQRARTALTEAAGDDAAAGGALLAHAALRWTGPCVEAGCVGLDRVEQLGHAARFDARIRSLADIWRVIALKDAIDHLDVAQNTIAFPKAAADLTDALAGNGFGPPDVDLLRRQRPDPGTWMGVGLTAGVEGATDWPAARAALLGALRQSIQRIAPAYAGTDLEEPLGRIARRATP
jgi:hypothetical protein